MAAVSASKIYDILAPLYNKAVADNTLESGDWYKSVITFTGVESMKKNKEAISRLHVILTDPSTGDKINLRKIKSLGEEMLFNMRTLDSTRLFDINKIREKNNTPLAKIREGAPYVTIGCYYNSTSIRKVDNTYGYDESKQSVAFHVIQYLSTAVEHYVQYLLENKIIISKSQPKLNDAIVISNTTMSENIKFKESDNPSVNISLFVNRETNDITTNLYIKENIPGESRPKASKAVLTDDTGKVVPITISNIDLFIRKFSDIDIIFSADNICFSKFGISYPLRCNLIAVGDLNRTYKADIESLYDESETKVNDPSTSALSDLADDYM